MTNWGNKSKTAGTTYVQEAQVILPWFKFLEMSSYQNIKIFIVNKKTIKSSYFCVFLTSIVCICSSHHIFFQCYLFLYSALLFFLEKQVAICTTTAQYLFKVWVLILNWSLEKAPGKGWPLLKKRVTNSWHSSLSKGRVCHDFVTKCHARMT